MNKKILAIILTTALSGTVTAILANPESDNDTTITSMDYTGIGIGAIAGTVVAGPAGLLVGSLVGAMTGIESTTVPEKTKVTKNPVMSTATDDIDYQVDKKDALSEKIRSDKTTTPETILSNNNHDQLFLAQTGSDTPYIDDTTDIESPENLAQMASGLSFDVFFRTGSSDIESFYTPRLTAIASLIRKTPKLLIHLEGYTDRRGDLQENKVLAMERIKHVQQYLLNAGIDKSRIKTTAFGETRTLTSPGDLAAYTFDRKVLIRFENKQNTFSENTNTSVHERIQKNIAEASLENKPVISSDVNGIE